MHHQWQGSQLAHSRSQPVSNFLLSVLRLPIYFARESVVMNPPEFTRRLWNLFGQLKAFAAAPS